MYNGSLQANRTFTGKMMPRSKKKNCGYYMKLIFFFSSLIQSLIIVSLVLFLVYGQPEQTVEEKRVQDLENSYSRLSLENVALRAKEKNLTQVLNVTATAKKLVEKDLYALRMLANSSSVSIKALQFKWNQCEFERKGVGTPACAPVYCPQDSKYLKHQLQQTEELLKLVRANFTEKMRTAGLDLQNALKAELNHRLESIELRRGKSYLQERINSYEKMCKEDFVHSLQGIPNVTMQFLKKVDEFLSKHVSFQLTCEKQSSQLEDIRTNCSNLSRDLESKLQVYLDRVGTQVTAALGKNAEYITENKRLKEDAAWCNGNRSAIISQNEKTLKDLQLKYDQEIEKNLLNIKKLTASNGLQGDLLSVKEIEVRMLSENVKDLNASLISCKLLQRNPFSHPSLNTYSGGIGAGGFGAHNTMGSLGPSFGGIGSASQGTSFGRTAGSSGGSTGMGLGSTGSAGFPKVGSANTVPSGHGGTNPLWSNFASAGTGTGTRLGNTGSIGAGVGNTGSTLGSIGSSGTAAGRAGLGTGATTALTSAGQSGTGVSSVGSSVSNLPRTGMGGMGFGAFGSNTAGNPFGGGRVPSGPDPLLNAQINNHLKELLRYTKQT